NFSLTGYESIRRDREVNDRGGVATFVRADLKFKTVEILKETEGIVIEVYLKQQTLIVANVYHAPGTVLNADELKRVFEKKNLVLTGDFKAHNPLWKSDRNDKNGELLEKLLDSSNCSCLNN